MKQTLTLAVIFTIAFFSVNAQQAVPNGGLETWTSISTPTSWTTLEDLIAPIAGTGLSVKDSVDKVEGNSSIVLTSKYVALASDTVPGILAIGSGVFAGGGPDFFGTPFTSKPDTLFFSYKYEPVGNDTAQVSLQLHKANGGNTYLLQVGSYLTSTNGQWVNVAAPLTSYYTDHVSACDTLKLRFESTTHSGGGNPIKGRVGSTLHLDALRFGYASQQTGTAPQAYTMGRDPLTGYNFNFYGAVNAMGDTGVYKFVYSTDSTFATQTTTPTQPLGGNNLKVVWATVNSLSPATTYYYRVKATTNQGSTTGATMHFYSDTVPFQFDNTGADVYGGSYAELHGRLSGFHNTVALSFEFGLSPATMDTVVASDQTTVSDSNTHYFRGFPNGFVPGSLYFYHVKAASATDTIYSDIRAFYMGNPYTTFQALPATSVTTTTATLNGTAQGFPVPIKLKSEIDGPGVSHKHTPFVYHDVTGSLINYTYNATGLQPNSYYSVRYKADTWIGNFYGDTAFTTLSTGIAETNPFTGVMISPNPAAKFLNIELENSVNSETTIQLTGLNGQLIKQVVLASSQNKTMLDVSDLESGLYMLRLVSGNMTYNKKISVIK